MTTVSSLGHLCQWSKSFGLSEMPRLGFSTQRNQVTRCWLDSQHRVTQSQCKTIWTNMQYCFNLVNECYILFYFYLKCLKIPAVLKIRSSACIYKASALLSRQNTPPPCSGLRQDKPTLRMKTKANSHYLVVEPDQMLGLLSVQPGSPSWNLNC